MAESAFDILNGSLVGDEGGPVTEDLPYEEYDPDPVIDSGTTNDLRFVTEGDFNLQSESDELNELPVQNLPTDVAFELSLLSYRPEDVVVGDEGGPVTEDLPYEEYDPDPVVNPGEQNDLRFVTEGDFNLQSDFEEPSPQSVPTDLAFELSVLSYRPETDTVVGDEDIEGDHFTRQAPGFDAYEAKRAAGDNPLVRYSDYPHVSRDWTLDFGPVNGPAGFTTVITASPQLLFRGEKIMATDTAVPAGTGTRIIAVTVGSKIQKPLGTTGTLTLFFDDAALANGITFDTAKPWSHVQVTVSFIKACTFDMTVFGKAVL